MVSKIKNKLKNNDLVKYNIIKRKEKKFLMIIKKNLLLSNKINKFY